LKHIPSKEPASTVLGAAGATAESAGGKSAGRSPRRLPSPPRRRLNARKGHFITFEGVEGSGKSFQIRRLERYLMRRSIPVLLTREPGGTEIGDGIRKLFLGQRAEGIEAWTELFLIEGARAQHLAEVVRPAIASGTTVLCDRFTDSTVAYQGYGRGLPLELIHELHALPALRPLPDLTLIFDLPVREGLARALGRNLRSARRSREARIDTESLPFHERVRRGFRSIAAQEPGRAVLIPASGAPAEIEEMVRHTVALRLGLGGR
jgi:dTMP kinase